MFAGYNIHFIEMQSLNFILIKSPYVGWMDIWMYTISAHMSYIMTLPRVSFQQIYLQEENVFLFSYALKRKCNMSNIIYNIYFTLQYFV